jgi:hypothetical protein
MVAVAGLFALVLADFAAAQPPGGGRGRGFGRGGGIIALAGNDAVQKELGIEAKEKEQIESLLRAYGEDAREQMQGIGNFFDASDEERTKMIEKMQEMNQKLMAKHLPELKKTLKPDQFKRLQEINWQASGSQALADPELAKTLDLSKEQQDKVAAVNREYQQKQRALFAGGAGGNFQEMGAKIREINLERDKKAEEVLSKEQQDKLKELKGKPFDLAKLRFGGPGGRPGGDRKGDGKEE